MSVFIINKGLVTAPLLAVILRPGRNLIEVSLPPRPLSGATIEKRELELRPAVPGSLDITIAFKISPEGGDLAGRDEIHLLLKDFLQGQQHLLTLRNLRKRRMGLSFAIVSSCQIFAHVGPTLSRTTLMHWVGETSDGAEFTPMTFMEWCEEQQIQRWFSEPGKPDQNTFVERFNRTYREEVLDAHLFDSLDQVREVTDLWIAEYNYVSYYPTYLCALKAEETLIGIAYCGVMSTDFDAPNEPGARRRR